MNDSKKYNQINHRSVDNDDQYYNTNSKSVVSYNDNNVNSNTIGNVQTMNQSSYSNAM